MLHDALPQGDVKPTCFPFAAAPAIRRATLDDIPFIREIALEKYPERAVEQGLSWMLWCLKNPERLVLVGANSVGMAAMAWRQSLTAASLVVIFSFFSFRSRYIFEKLK